MKHYTLNDEGEPIFEPDAEKWALWFENANLHVADDDVGNARVSTVFLGIGWDDGPSAIWETVIFGGPLDQVKDRCLGSREQAESMHKKTVSRVHAAT
ncbi:MAG: hypothetical protein WCS42_22690 [Verrucomicrobiota bacterium]